ncbi:hypothetical protein EK0264_17940 [Epidermidibacterium keratini]|uniref:Uncharacterized protein n=1 Tax=Epidermidibacterium keratini TaxID=1891644 RepID=A0A7L4YRU8_9ACTN|nr:hypothetical protein [Epidermidibacterium keratini]QHC01971.1 hypothetical protein EK0264_17940 [Epidermidibacterium keratini]
MFAGHYAVAFGARALAPAVPLGVLFVAAQASDIVSSVLLLLTVERVRIDPSVPGQQAVVTEFVPFSHGFIAAAALALAAAFATRRWLPRAGRRGAVAVGAVVATHPLLDLVTAGPLALFVIETGLYVLGCVLYLRATPKAPTASQIAMGAFMLGLLGFSVVVATSSPPSSVTALALANLGAYGVLAALAAWLDRSSSARRHLPAGTARR